MLDPERTSPRRYVAYTNRIVYPTQHVDLSHVPSTQQIPTPHFPLPATPVATVAIGTIPSQQSSPRRSYVVRGRPFSATDASRPYRGEGDDDSRAGLAMHEPSVFEDDNRFPVRSASGDDALPATSLATSCPDHCLLSDSVTISNERCASSVRVTATSSRSRTRSRASRAPLARHVRRQSKTQASPQRIVRHGNNRADRLTSDYRSTTRSCDLIVNSLSRCVPQVLGAAVRRHESATWTQRSRCRRLDTCAVADALRSLSHIRLLSCPMPHSRIQAPRCHQRRCSQQSDRRRERLQSPCVRSRRQEVSCRARLRRARATSHSLERSSQRDSKRSTAQSSRTRRSGRRRRRVRCIASFTRAASPSVVNSYCEGCWSHAKRKLKSAPSTTGAHTQSSVRRLLPLPAHV